MDRPPDEKNGEIFPAYRGPGKPPHAPTEQARRMVEYGIAAGFKQEQIAEIIGIDPKTLRLHYRKELDTAEVKIGIAVAQTAVMQAIGGPSQNWKEAEPSMTRFVLERRFDWKSNDTVNVNNRGAIGIYDASKLAHLSTEELEQFDRLLARLEPPAAIGNQGGNSEKGEG